AQPSNVLLERLGREAVEVQIQTASQRWPSHPVIGAGVTEPANTALARLQQAVQQDEPLTAGTVHEDDHSIQFHQCHGPDRQVEVLRESILGLLSDDPTLEPRDIIVQCPAIDSYAPLLHASFGLEVDGAAHPGLEI
ncbi:exodeoxyribonuclease V subunit gamma, partial [Escherichia coli]|nr:exodeoxyribonuclease V subunit gamma [Escherichia coli]MWL01771.1 exodeoxyribonuclease V subunit gamma [Escherichia coli]